MQSRPNVARPMLALAAALLLGVTSGAFAQTGGRQAQNPRNAPNSSDEAQKQQITDKLAAEGVTDVSLRPQKHGWQGTGMRDGKKVRIEVNERGQWSIKNMK